MSQFIDRRPNSRNKSAENRQRFIRRFKKQIKQAVSDAISGRSITNINKGEKINIPKKDITEPQFKFGKGGRRHLVMPGNKSFQQGDRMPRPPTASDQDGSQASNTGEGTDDFIFQLSREEFLDVFFEDLELPNLVRKELSSVPAYKMVRAGFTRDGIPANINIVRSLKSAMCRRLALGGTYRKKIKAAQHELQLLIDQDKEDSPEAKELRKEIARLQLKLSRAPFIDPFDLRYNHRIKQPTPSAKAVMFCLMDVSGSMDETKKDIAKRFFILLYLFLTKSYDSIQIVFIRHHTSAKEVDEHEFFYSRETGGTVVSSALELMHKVIKERFPINDWNIYAAQASDGDNWNNDSPHCQTILSQYIMPLVQYFAYVEIMPRHHQSLWEAYLDVNSKFDNFSMQHINNFNEIYPVFREFFKSEKLVSTVQNAL